MTAKGGAVAAGTMHEEDTMQAIEEKAPDESRDSAEVKAETD